MSAPEPAFRRLAVDERRRRLLELGARLFTTHTYTELSMSAIAREAGISKALLYHYFPSKQEFFRETLAAGVGELRASIEPDPSLAPAEQLLGSLRAYVDWIGANREAYAKLLQTAQSVEEVRELVDAQREQTAQLILAGVFAGAEPTAAARAAVRGWLWFMDGACLDWIENGGFDRDALVGLLVGTLIGALTASGADLSLS